jgi:hypothetical protein
MALAEYQISQKTLFKYGKPIYTNQYFNFSHLRALATFKLEEEVTTLSTS